jgi:hypothetical protein
VKEMTLDLAKVSVQIEEMGEHLLEDGDRRRQQLARARSYFERMAPEWLTLAEIARSRKIASAAPTERLDAHHPRREVPPGYEVIASDGSTVEPDRHGPALCALVNVGRVRIRYGPDSSATLESEPTLYFRENDLYVEHEGRRVLLRERWLDAWRSIAEMAALADLAGSGDTPDLPRVALADGLLLLWREDWAEGDAEMLTKRFTQALDSIAQARLPLAAYVSRPTSHWVVDLLRETAGCSSSTGGCKLGCGDEPCTLARLGDADLFGFLAPGERSALFEMTGLYAERFGTEHRAQFFYLQVGRELARVEVPAWVARNAESLTLLHAVICDQAERGAGYPVALARAHEQAVLGGYDRRVFQQLVVSALARRGFDTALSEKQSSKNLRAI